MKSFRLILYLFLRSLSDAIHPALRERKVTTFLAFLVVAPIMLGVALDIRDQWPWVLGSIVGFILFAVSYERFEL